MDHTGDSWSDDLAVHLYLAGDTRKELCSCGSRAGAYSSVGAILGHRVPFRVSLPVHQIRLSEDAVRERSVWI